MGLALYRRHRRGCKGHHPEECRTSEYDERKKGWSRCECPIFVSGTLDGTFKRQNTGQWEWNGARVVAIHYETAGSWSGPKPLPQPAAQSGDSQQRITITEATEAFLTKCQNRGIAQPTLAKYKTFIKQLRAYCDEHGYTNLDQLTVSDMDRFYASWEDGKRAKAKKLERLKAFVRFCCKREWMARNIADDLEAPEGSSIAASKTPFTDEELQRIYEACDKHGGPKPAGPGYRPWSGEDVKDFTLLSVYTGLRISDVATFNAAKRLRGNNVFLRMHKTQKELWTWIPDWLVHRLRERQRANGPLIFRIGHSTVMRTVAELWRVRLAKVFKLAGPFEEPATPHRFRHTFVRILLEKGIPAADVAELIGDTEAILRKHYSKWMPERQARLTRILQEAFADKPKPKIVAMPKQG